MMFHLEPFFPEDNNSIDGCSFGSSVSFSNLTNHSIVKNQRTEQYKELAKQIINQCYQEPNALIHLFDTICRDLANPCLSDKSQTFELVMSVLAGTYCLDSTASFKEYLEDRYRENPHQTPQLCKLVTQAFEILDASDIDIILSSTSFEALYRKASRIHLSANYDESVHKFNELYIPIIESYINLEATDLDTVFHITDKFLDDLTSTVEDKNKCPSYDLIAKTIAILGSQNKQQLKFISSYLDSLITSEDDFFSELAGYSFALIKRLTPRFGSAIFEHLVESFHEAENEDKEFWTIAMAEFSSYDRSIAPKCIGLLQPLVDGDDELRVSYASEAIAKIVNQIGGNIWDAAGIKQVGNHLLEKDPAFAISHQQRIIFIAKSIASIDKDNYAQVISDIEDLFSTLRQSSLFADVRDSIYLTLDEYAQYTADEIQNETLKRVERSLHKEDLPIEISELYAHLLKASITGYIDTDPDKKITSLDELVSRYSILSEKLSKFPGASLLSQTVEEIGSHLYTSQIFNFKQNPVMDFD